MTLAGASIQRAPQNGLKSCEVSLLDRTAGRLAVTPKYQKDALKAEAKFVQKNLPIATFFYEGIFKP